VLIRPLFAVFTAAVLVAEPGEHPSGFSPGKSVLLDAHNAYPDQGRWGDRLDRALSTGTPLAIEQDLIWRTARTDLPAGSVVSHGEPFTWREPTLRDFFERIRPLAIRALKADRDDQWPIITLNLDFKDSRPEHFLEIWRMLGEYEPWLTTAPRVANGAEVQPLDLGPILVLTGADPAQQVAFHDSVPVGARLRLFGAAPAGVTRATNYLRWSNNAWSAVEPEGQNRAGDWTPEDADRLRRLVNSAHAGGLWIRFYTLNGHTRPEGDEMGWTASYNFGSIDAARLRWRAAIDARVDYLATDQYEAFAALLRAR
jgi:hypothetical protein